MSESRWWWLSTDKMTVMVGVRDGVIFKAPPIVHTFVGQPLENLERWMKKQPEFRIQQVVQEET